MIRRIIKINEKLCTGCGVCAEACHEGAIDIVDGKARLAREHYCDGLGDCLPECPTGAITFEEREAPAYDEVAVAAAKLRHHEHGREHRHEHGQMHRHEHGESGCPGARMRVLAQSSADTASTHTRTSVSQLAGWPCQIRLVPVKAPYFEGAELLVAADCTAYAYANFHEEFMRGRVTLIGCPKLDPVDYSGKLTEIIHNNNIKSITVARMEVPCCGGLERAARTACAASDRMIPFRVVTVSIDGKIL